MRVAIAIVGFRNVQDIVHCLDALERSTHTDFEVVICENGGPAGFAALQAVLPAALPGGQLVRAVLAPGNLGFAGGVNVCLREAPDADAWWVLNPDTEPHADALSAMIRRLAVGDCEAVGCTLHFPDRRVQSHGGLWRTWLSRFISIGHGSSLDDPVDKVVIERRQNYLNGASMLIGKRFMEVVGPMREDYFLYAEEVEWCARGLARGMRLGYAADGFVLHRQGTTTGAGGHVKQRSRVSVYLAARNEMLVTRDTFPMKLPVAALAALARIGLAYARRGAWRQVGFALSGWSAGLLNERGPPKWLEAAVVAAAKPPT